MSLRAAVSKALEETKGTANHNSQVDAIVTAFFNELADNDFRREIFESATEEWDDSMGDLSMLSVHTVMDAMLDVLSDREYAGVSDGD